MRNWVLLVLVLMGMSLNSCGIAKRSSMQDMAGDWNVVSLNGKTVSVSGERHPYMGFNLQDGIMSGTTGCNRMMGAVTVDGKLRTISFGPISGTRMACPDMSVEQAIFEALEKVRSYTLDSKGTLSLLDENGDELMILSR